MIMMLLCVLQQLEMDILILQVDQIITIILIRLTHYLHGDIKISILADVLL